MSMDVRAVAYQTIAILHFLGELKAADVETLREDLAQECADFSRVLLHLDEARLDRRASEALVQLRDQSKAKAPRLYLVSGKMAGADAAELPGALDLIHTLESDRILKLFEKGYALTQARDGLQSVHRRMAEMLGVGDAVSEDALILAVARAHEESGKLKYLSKTLGFEIEVLRKQRGRAGAGARIPKETEERVTDARRQALAVLKKAKVFA